MFKPVLEKSYEPEIKLPTSAGSWKKQESSRKTSISALLTMPKPWTVWTIINWKILKEMEIPGHLTCLLRNLYAGQEATVRTGHGSNRLVPNRKRSTSRLYTVTLLIELLCRVHHEKCWAGVAQAGIKIAGRNINNLRYAEDTTLMAENEEELKSLLMKVKEESEQVGLKLSSVQFSHSVVSDSLRPHEVQHARPPCPSPTAGVYANPCPLSW